ncbi:hypothetical protein T492DRAFT_842878 [Pavlovales sp. CCMP2436]|nr:hypothetical protein T492DRAFT_842878 [Pavlovales sp. CCMP2436]|eukprot:CAMPEP_0179859612 /NCGR_PEP_ID=MMETSP0982-20121206/13110_1 /TAXON_ID=483367 /ORGANISM="non described non described, Strain CCMP 2436" /LENGTH=190 /DNA_ID=CAMNT_0021746677 /DNA_START=13 /DNA_END=585 /DNA_ORIENTATION=-
MSVFVVGGGDIRKLFLGCIKHSTPDLDTKVLRVFIGPNGGQYLDSVNGSALQSYDEAKLADHYFEVDSFRAETARALILHFKEVSNCMQMVLDTANDGTPRKMLATAFSGHIADLVTLLEAYSQSGVAVASLSVPPDDSQDTQEASEVQEPSPSPEAAQAHNEAAIATPANDSIEALASQLTLDEVETSA